MLQALLGAPARSRESTVMSAPPSSPPAAAWPCIVRRAEQVAMLATLAVGLAFATSFIDGYGLVAVDAWAIGSYTGDLLEWTWATCFALTTVWVAPLLERPTRFANRTRVLGTWDAAGANRYRKIYAPRMSQAPPCAACCRHAIRYRGLSPCSQTRHSRDKSRCSMPVDRD
jgi:hypothetical protein